MTTETKTNSIQNPPAHLTDSVARDTWAELINAAKPGHFQDEDFPLLEAYCETISLSREATRQWREAGSPFVIVNSNGTTGAHPLMTARTAASRSIGALATRLRLCPAARKPIEPKRRRSALDDL